MVQQLDQYRVDSIKVMYDHFWFVVVHLTGKAENPLNWEEFSRKPSKKMDSGETFKWIWFFWSRIQIAFYMGKLELADSMVKMFFKLSVIDTSYLVTSIRVLFTGLIATGLARKTGKRKYIARARKATSEMKKIMMTRGLNNLHRYLLMEADIKACTLPKTKHQKVKEAFDKAISASGKAGFTQDTALASELAGEYFLRIGDKFWRNHYFTRSYQLYDEWGAKAKVENLREHRGSYIDNTEKSRKRSTVTSSNKHWVSGRDSEVHKSINLDSLSGTSQLDSISAHDGASTIMTDDKSVNLMSTRESNRLSRFGISRGQTEGNRANSGSNRGSAALSVSRKSRSNSPTM